MSEAPTKEEAAKWLKSLKSLADYISGRGIDAFLDEGQFFQLDRVIRALGRAEFKEEELSQIGRLAGFDADQMQALWMSYEWHLAYTIWLQNEADVQQMRVLKGMFEQIFEMAQGVYYLSHAEKAALYWYNEQANLGENNRLYLLKLAAQVGLEPAHLIYLTQLAGRH